MTTVKIERRTDKGVNIENTEIEKMSFKQMINVAKGVSRIVRFINDNEKLQNVFKQFNSVREEVKQEAIEYYKAEKKKGKKEENIEEYDIGTEAITRTGTRVWNDLLSILADLLDEIPEVIAEILSDASGISKKDIDNQDPIVVMDILDALVEVNDFNKIVERIKKSKDTFQKIKPAFNNQATQEK